MEMSILNVYFCTLEMVSLERFGALYQHLLQSGTQAGMITSVCPLRLSTCVTSAGWQMLLATNWGH